MSDQTIYRVAVTGSQWQAVMEAVADAVDTSSFVARELAHLSLSIKNSMDSGWTWRMEDEA